MNTTRKDLPKSQVELTIELTQEAIAPFRQRAVQRLSSQADLPGFRKGKIPEKVLIDNYGEPAIMSEMYDMAISKTLAEAVENEKLNIITQPEIELRQTEPFTYVAKLTVLPEVELGDWEKFEAKARAVKVEKKEIDEVLKNLQQRFLERNPVDRAAKDGDFIEIDFDGKTPDGVPLDGAQSKFHPVVLGQGMLLPDFEKNIIGMQKGEEKKFTITFPKDYGAKHMAGKDVVFEVKLHSVNEQVEPKIDEAFGEKVFGKKMDEAAIRAEIEKILLEKAEDEERKRRENELIDQWEKLAKVEMPEVLVEEEVQNMLHVMKDRAQMAGADWSSYLQNMKKTEEEYVKELRPDAEKRAKQRLVLGKIVGLSKVELSDEEVKQKAEVLHHEMHSQGHEHSDDHSTDAGSNIWRQAYHLLTVEKLFDTFLGEAKKEA